MKYCFYVLFSLSIYSCMSIESSYKAEFNYNAKVKLLNENNIYKSSISVNPDTIIIQFYEYFVGNIARIKLTEKNITLSENIEKDDDFKSIIELYDAKYFQIIQNCLYKKEVKFINKEVEVNCDNFGDIKIYIYGLGEISIKLAISRKLERKDKTPAASK